MQDDFKKFAPSLSSPPGAAEEITPNDSQELGVVTRAIYVGGGGDLRVRLISGDTVTLTGVKGGVLYPMRVTHVLATDTTATNLVGLR